MRSLMNRILLKTKVPASFWLVVLTFLVGTNAMAQRFVHPSIPFTKYDLDQLKANINQEPWRSAYNALAADNRSKLSYGMQGPFTEVGRAPNLNNTKWISDMQAIHNLTFMWIFTGDSAYARKATNMLDAWAVTNTIWSGGEAMLDIGDYVPYFVTAADILRGLFPGWTDSNTVHVKKYFANVIWPQSWVPYPPRDNNKGALQMEIALSVAAFLDDQVKWDQAIELYRLDATAALRCSLPNGEVGDAGRDDHWFVQAFALMYGAEIAWKQGIDLYSEYGNRLYAIGELYNKYAFVGDTMTFIPFGGSAVYWQNWGIAPGARKQHPFNNLIKGAYALRKGIPTPYTEQMRAAVGEGGFSFLYLKSSDTSTAVSLPPINFPVSEAASHLTNMDIGNPGIAGSAAYSNGKWTVKGAGTLAATSSNFTFKPVTGDFTIIAKIDSNYISSATAGVMVRDGLAASANNIALNLYNGSVNTRWNGSVSGYTHYPPKAPWWLKLERIGNRIFSYHSKDGVNWSCHNCIYNSFAQEVYVGIFTISNNTSVLNTTVFSNVSITNSTAAGAPQISAALSATTAVGAAFNYAVAATNNPQSYSATGLPDGLSIDASTGVISGTPTTAGTTAVTINATNGNGTGTAVLMITVNNSVAPAAPVGLTTTVVNTTQIRLSWTTADGANSYSVKRSLTAGGPYTTIQTGITGTSFVDANPAFEVNNYYVVTAFSGNLESGNSGEVFGNVPPAIPSKPVIVIKNNELDLQWDAAAGAVTYKVKRATVAGGPYTVIAQVSATSHADMNVANGTGYYYVVSSMGNTLESGNSIESFSVPGSNGSTWSETPASANWNSASNWVEGAVPASPAILTFRSTADSVLTNDITGLEVSRLLFDTMASDYTIGGNSIKLKTDLVNNSAYWQTVSTPIIIDSQVTLSGVTGMNVTGVISGAGSLLKMGGGTVQLTGKNTYSGNTMLNGPVAIAGTGTGTSGAPTAGPLGTGKIIMNGGTLYSGDSAATIYNDIHVNAGIRSFLTQSVNSISIYGRITGSGTLWEDGNDYPGINLFGDNSGFTGTFVAALRSGRNRVRFMVPQSGSANALWNLDANGIDCIGIHFSSGTLHLGGLTGRGYFRNDAGGAPVISIGALNTDTWFGGTMNNYFEVVKVGTGSLNFTGNHTYGGTTTIKSGKFLLNNNSATGTFPSPIIVEGGAYGGAGRSQATVKVGTGSGTGASLEPGNNNIATLTTSAALTMNQDATYNAELSIVNTTSDKMSAAGVTLNNAVLSVKAIDSGALASGANLVIIDNSGSNAVTGTFLNLPELALVTVKGYNFRITYKGGDGNDVALMDERVLPVTISSKTSDTVLLNRSYTYTITAIKSPTSYNATGLPAGLTVNTATGVISGVPTVAGAFAVSLTAANDTSTGTAVLNLFVRNTVVDGVTAIAGMGKNTIEWNQVLNLGYKVKRGIAAAGPFTTLTSTNNTFYVDSAITGGTTYYYVLAAYDSTGEFGNSVPVTPVVTTGAYSYWNFNDSSATSAMDLWGNRKATLNSGVTRVAGAIKQGIKLDGTSNGYASLPTGAVSSLNDFTISGWVKLDVAGNWARVFDFGTGTNVYMFLGRTNTGLLRYAITTGGGSKEQGINSNTTISTGVYTHVAVTWSGNVGILYMNGQEVGRNSAMTLKPSNLGNTTQNWFGRSQYSADAYLNGILDDIRIYNRQLSALEVVNLVNSAAPSQPSGLTVTSAATKNIQLTWTASTGATSYSIKRSTISGSGYTVIASATGASFTDTTIAGGGPYYYIVTAKAGLFESAPSNQVTVLLAPAAVTYPIATSWNKRIDVSWVGASGATSYTVKRTTGGDTTTIATVTGVTYSDTSVTNETAYSYVIYAANAAGTGAASAVATAAPVNQPNSWLHNDIGSTVLTGNAGYANGITAYGSGADIWGNADAFHYTYQSLSGNGAIVARIASLQNYATSTTINGAAKAGVMVREALTAGARHGLVNVTPTGGMEFIKRIANNGSTTATSTAGITAPYWVKLVRNKDTLTTYRSADGIGWTTVGSQIYTTLATNVYIGLAVCSHNTGVITRGVFDTVSLATTLPVITSAKTDTAIGASSFSFTVTATNSAFRYAAAGLPGGLAINIGTGVISGAPAVPGKFPVVVTATNAMGTATDTLTLTVLMPPSIITRNIQVAVGDDGTASITPQQVDSASMSYSGELALSLDRTGFSCADIGTPVTVTLTGTDSAGLSRSATAQVTVVDDKAPKVTAPQDQFFCYSDGGTYTVAALTATDNCGVALVSYTVSGATTRNGAGANAGGAFNAGTSTIVYTVTDVHGNTITDTTLVTVNAALIASIPDVYAMNPAVDQKNTIYIGYGPASLATTAIPQGGTAPYSYLWNTGDTTASITVTAAGTFTATVTDSKGCTTTVSIEMKTLDVRCGNNNNKVMICHNNKTICISSDGVQDHLNHGDYLGNCSAGVARQSTSATGTNGNASIIFVYPNPVSETLTIQIGANTGAVMQLYNSSGVLVATERLVNSTTALSVKTLPAGVYYLRIQNGATVNMHKIVKL
ncbi:LamG-like jellyroll fold domain-containing protein [Niastella caeni]|nr:LamG-like jellyroll fold domain-containing protein [Niastella caeni]